MRTAAFRSSLDSLLASRRLALALSLGCRSAEKVLAPSNFRDWTPEQAVLPTPSSTATR